MRGLALAVLLAVVALATAPPALGATVTFDGSTSQDWNTGSNWDTGNVPGAADDAVIPALLTARLETGSDSSVLSLSVQGALVVRGRSLTVGAGTSTIAGNVTVDQSGALDLGGTTNWTAGTLAVGGFANTGSVENSGQLNVSTSGGAPVAADNGSSSVLVNTGTLNYNGPGTSNWSIAVDNDGQLNVIAGTLGLLRGSGGATSAGAHSVSSGATLAFNGFPSSHVLGAAASVTGAGTVALEGDQLSLAAGAVYSPARTLVSGGFLSLAGAGTTGAFATDGGGGGRDGAGTLTVGSGASNLNTVTFRGGGTTVFPAGQTLPVTGQVSIGGSTTVRLNGTTNLSSGSWFFGNFGEPAAVLENAGTLNIPGDVSLSHGGGAVGRMHNLPGGTINRTTSAGTVTFNLPLDNDGTIDVQTGTLQLTDGSGAGASSGVYSADAGAVLAFGGGSPTSITGAGAELGGSGTVRFDSGTVSVAAESVYDAATTLISGGFISLAGAETTGAFASDGAGGGRDGAGTLTVGSGSSNLDNVTFRGAGTTIFPAGVTLPVTGAVSVEHSTTVRLNGTTNLSSGSWFFGSFGQPAAVLENGGTLNIPGDVSLQHGGGAVGRMHNLPGGTINRTASASTATLGLPLDNDGALNVQSGTLQLTEGTGGQTSSGSYTAAAGTTLAFGGGQPTSIGSGGSIGGPGTVTFDGGTVTVAAGASYDPATSLFSGGFLALDGPGSTGAFATDGTGGGRDGAATLTVTGGGSNLSNVTFRGGGTTVFPSGQPLEATGPVQVAGSTTVRLNGTTNWSGGSWSIGNFAQPAGVVENAGTLNATGDGDMVDGGGAVGLVRNLAGGTINRTTGGGEVVMPELQNAGTVNVDSGTLAPRQMSQSAGATDVAAGTTLQSGTVALQGGTLTGSGTVDADLSNTGGTVGPGTSPGIMAVDGNYTQGPGGTLRTEIAGTTPGTGFDQLSVTGSASLDGTLAIVTDPGFDPAVTDTFEVVASTGALSGTFTTLTGAQLGGGKTYTPFYTAGPPGRVTLGLQQPAPSNTTAPSLPGSAQVGDTVTCNPGTWTGSPSFTFAWLRDGTGISGATAGTYTIAAADAGRSIVCRVTATNGGGSASADSGPLVPSSPQGPAPAAPVNTSLPALPATAEVGDRVTCDPGAWTGSPSFAFAWLRDGAPVSGATGPSYRLTAADAGTAVVCRVTGTNAGGSAVAESGPLAATARTETIRGPEAFTEGTANDLYLACTKLDLWLIDVLPRGSRRVYVSGAADLRLAGRTVGIFLGQRGPGKRVGRAQIQPDGSFETIIPAPRGARARKAARYQARVGGTRSQRLRLIRRMVATELAVEGGTLELSGVLLRPFARPPAVIVIERYLSCRRRERVAVAPVRPDGRGRFRVEIPVPDGSAAVLYRARTRAPTATTGRIANVFTLPRALDL